MPRFGPEQVPDDDIAVIYAYLQTLPQPANPIPSVLALITPEAGLATVRGTLRYSPDGAPAAGQQVVLLDAERTGDGQLRYIYRRLHLPAAVTDAQGQFVFEDVQPGTYALFYSLRESEVRSADGAVVAIQVGPGEIAEVEGFMPR